MYKNPIFSNCAVLLAGEELDVMQQVAIAVLRQGGRVWLASSRETETKRVAETLMADGPVDYFSGKLQDEHICAQLAELIYQTDGFLDVLVQLTNSTDADGQLLEETLNTTFFKPQGKGHVVRWAWDGNLPQPSKATQSSARVHALFAPPTEAAIPHILHLASPAAEALQETRLSLI